MLTRFSPQLFSSLLMGMAASSTMAQPPVDTFSLPDVNPTSTRRATALNTADVTPRDFLHQVSAWYFGSET